MCREFDRRLRYINGWVFTDDNHQHTITVSEALHRMNNPPVEVDKVDVLVVVMAVVAILTTGIKGHFYQSKKCPFMPVLSIISPIENIDGYGSEKAQV